MRTRSMLRYTTIVATTLALAGAFTLAPAVVGTGGFNDAAYAKNGNGNGGGGGNGNGGGKDRAEKSGQKSNKGGGTTRARGNSDNAVSRTLDSLFGKPQKTNRASTKARGAPVQKAEPETEVVEVEEVLEPLTPDQKGRWNALNANQAAIDAHVRAQQFNGTIGVIAQMQLAGKAASGAELNEYEQAALASFVSVEEMAFSDEDLEAFLNGDGTDDVDMDGLNDTLPTFDVVGGTATCISLCEGVDATAANQDLEDYIAEQNAAAEAEAYANFFNDSEQRVLDESNKSTDGIEDQLLDHFAELLGYTRPEPVEEPAPEGEVLLIEEGESPEAL